MAVGFDLRQTPVSGADVCINLNQHSSGGIHLKPWSDMAIVGELADNGRATTCDRQMGL